MPHVRDLTCPECGKLFTAGGIRFHRLYNHQVAAADTLAAVRAGKFKSGKTPAARKSEPAASTSGGVGADSVPPGSQRRRSGFFSR